MKRGSTIHTGVDGLVSIVEDKERISFKDAAKLLGVSVNTIEEWAHFLAEEKVIDVEYNIRNPVLIRLQLSPEQKQRMRHDFEQERTIFHNKLKSMTSYFDQLDSQIKKVDKIVDDLDDHLEHQIDDIKGELTVLHTLDTQKITLHEQLLESKQKIQVKLDEIDKHLAQERVKYKQYEVQERQALEKEEKLFDEANEYLSKVKKDEKELEQRLIEVKKMSGEIEKRIGIYAKGVTEGERRIQEIKSKHDKLVGDLEQEYKTIQNLLAKSEHADKEYKKRIEETMVKIRDHEKNLDKKTKSVNDLPSMIQSLIKNKSTLHDLISSLKHDEVEIQKEIKDLHERSKVVEYKIGTDEYKKFMDDLNARVAKLGENRNHFEEKIKAIISLITFKR